MSKVFVAFFDMLKSIFEWFFKLTALTLVLFTIVYLYMGGNI